MSLCFTQIKVFFSLYKDINQTDLLKRKLKLCIN